jgi:hypothetical protein
MKIAVVLPSRGLIFSQTADELLQNLQGFDYMTFSSRMACQSLIALKDP